MAHDPARTRGRILAAALKEFSAHGFAGARVDRIARRARINKRMLYHYFGDKAGLFRAILRHKLAEKVAAAAATPDDPAESLAYWLDLASRDLDWLRLLEWEALRTGDERVVEEEARRAAYQQGLARLRMQQARGFLSDQLDPGHILLSMIALTTFPLAFPQITRFATGLSPRDPKFREARTTFLHDFAAAFRPATRLRG